MQPRLATLWRHTVLAVLAAGTAGARSFALAPRVSAHERWFVDDGTIPFRFGPGSVGVTLLALGVMAAAVGLVRLTDRALGR